LSKHPEKKTRRGRLLLKIVAGAVVWSVLAVTVWVIYSSSVGNKLPPPREVTIVVEKGMTTAQIARLLADEGVVESALTFKVYMSVNGADRAVQPGSYHLKTGMLYSRLLDKLMAGPPKKMFTLLVPEGFTLDQITTRLAKMTGRPKEEFDAAAKGEMIREYDFKDLPLGTTSLEGYLFPKTYTMDEKWSPKQIISRLLSQFETETALVDWSFARQKGLSKKDIITVASLIEGEAKVPEERSLVAAVIYNRIQKNMPLQIDASVQYAMPERKDVLTYNDYKYPSPYNTYLKPGLPPGPIANPGLDAIKAALAPAQVDYLYYVLTSPDGHHTFTSNYNEFLRAKKGAGL